MDDAVLIKVFWSLAPSWTCSISEQNFIHADRRAFLNSLLYSVSLLKYSSNFPDLKILLNSLRVFFLNCSRLLFHKFERFLVDLLVNKQLLL